MLDRTRKFIGPYRRGVDRALPPGLPGSPAGHGSAQFRITGPAGRYRPVCGSRVCVDPTLTHPQVAFPFCKPSCKQPVTPCRPTWSAASGDGRIKDSATITDNACRRGTPEHRSGRTGIRATRASTISGVLVRPGPRVREIGCGTPGNVWHRERAHPVVAAMNMTTLVQSRQKWCPAVSHSRLGSVWRAKTPSKCLPTGLPGQGAGGAAIW